MKYFLVWLFGLIIGLFWWVWLSAKVVMDFGIDKMYDEVFNAVNSIFSGGKLQIQQQRDLLLKEIEYKKEELKSQIKQQIKEAINKKIDELLNF